MPDEEFAHMSTADLRVMLQDTLRHASPQDAPFVRRISLAIARREAEHADS